MAILSKSSPIQTHNWLLVITSCSITKWRSEPGTSSVAFLLLNNAARKSYIAFPSQKYPFAARTLLRLLTTTIPRHYSCAVTSLKTDRRFPWYITPSPLGRNRFLLDERPICATRSLALRFLSILMRPVNLKLLPPASFIPGEYRGVSGGCGTMQVGYSHPLPIGLFLHPGRIALFRRLNLKTLSHIEYQKSSIIWKNKIRELFRTQTMVYHKQRNAILLEVRIRLNDTKLN
jgi:hypothetical protein